MRYWVGEGVGFGVVVEKVRGDEGWKWRARILGRKGF